MVNMASCSTDFVPGTDHFHCEVNDLDNGEIASVQITSHATTTEGCGNVPNTATVSAAIDTVSGNNSDSGDITVNCANPNVSKSASTSSIGFGEQFSYEIEVNNNGTALATGVVLNDTLSGASLVSIDSPDGAFDCEGTPGSFP